MIGRLTKFGQRGRAWQMGAAVVVVLAIAAGAGAIRLVRAAPSLPTAEVRRGEFVDRLQVRGEVKAIRSVVLTAPSGAGDIQIIKLAKTGDMVKQGEVVVLFDTTTLNDTLNTRSSELKQSDAEIEGARAHGRMVEEQDLTDLAKAKYDVERAKLDAGKQEILSAIDGEKSKLTLSDAEQALREAEQRLVSNRAATAADINSKKQKREKALFDVRQTERNISRMTLRTPVAGMVAILPNFRAGGSGMFATDPPFREGDRAWPGANVAELPDLSSVQVAARVDETDRGRMAVGQQVNIRVDALPDAEFTGRILEISPLTKIDYSNWPPVKNFDLRLQIDKPDPRLRPGMSATARIAVERIADAIIIPAEASFQKSGKTLAYVLRGSRFEERVIEVSRRSNGNLAVARGLNPGERVALKDPTLEKDKKQ